MSQAIEPVVQIRSEQIVGPFEVVITIIYSVKASRAAGMQKKIPCLETYDFLDDYFKLQKSYREKK